MKQQNNTNDIDYEEIFYKCTENFFINKKDLDAVNRNIRAKLKKNLTQSELANKNKFFQSNIDYDHHLKPFLSKNNPENIKNL